MSEQSDFVKRMVKDLLEKRAYSGKLVPFVFYKMDPGDLEEALGEHVSVLSADKAGLVAALSSPVPVIVEGLDVTPPDLVGDVVRLLRSYTAVVCRVIDPEACKGYKEDGKYVEPCSKAVHPRILSAVVPFEAGGGSLSMSWMAGGEDDLSSEKMMAIDTLCDMIPGKPVTAHTAHDVFDRCRASVKTYWGTKDGFRDLMWDLKEKLAAAAAADVARSATPLEVAKRAAKSEVKQWLLETLGLERVSPAEFAAAVGDDEVYRPVLLGVGEYFRSVEAHDGPLEGIPSPEAAKAGLAPLVRAMREALDARKPDAHTA